MAENTVNTKIPKDTMTDFVVKEFERYEQHWASRFAEADKVYNSWRNRPPHRDYDWQNAVHVPLTIEAEQTITPRLHSAMFPNDAPIDVRPVGDTPPEQAVVIRDGVKHYMKVSNVQGHMLRPVSQAVLFGTGYAEAGSWLTRRGWLVNQRGKRINTIIENRPDFKPVSYFEMYPHPAKLYMWDGLPLIRRRFIDAETLKKLGDNPQSNFKNLTEALNSESPITKATVFYGQDGKPLEVKKREEYEVLEYWGPWDASYKDDNGKEKVKKAIPYWIMVINRKVKIMGIENPYNHQIPPFIKLKGFEDPKPSWFGVGVGMIGQSTQDRVNKLVNQRLDNVDLCLNKQGVYDGNDNLLNVRQLMVSKPGKFHKVSSVQTSVSVWDFGDVTASSYKEEELAKQDFKDATGATIPLQVGSDISEQHRTAMGIQLLQGAAGERFKPVLKMMEIDGLQQIAFFYFSNLQQFMTQAQWIEVFGQDNQPVPFLLTPQALQAQVQFVPTGISETVSREMQIGQLLRFREITQNDPTVNRVVINRRIAELFGFKDLQELFVQQQPTEPGGLPQAQQQMIRQRLAEGASPDQIKEELLGPPPSPEQVQQAQAQAMGA